jgi:branched-subunit amino acid transport protein
MEVVFLVAGMAAVTYLIRYGLLPLSGRIRFSDGLRRALGYVPPAVLTAIIAPAVLLPGGQELQITWNNAYLAGAVCTVAIGVLGKNLLLTIVGGMGAFTIWQWMLKIWL